MKYMGSKRAMLRNGLGAMLLSQAKKKARVVDLFCGSSSVAWFAAQHCTVPVFATDLQKYSVVVARAVLNRTAPLSADLILSRWFARAAAWRSRKRVWQQAISLDSGEPKIGKWARQAQELCAVSRPQNSPMWKAYGGYYFSPTQALIFDSMLATLPHEQSRKTMCHAALIIAASKCAAAPGHTAQPFKPNRSAGPFLREAWQRDPADYVRKAAHSVCALHARVKGSAKVGDAVVHATRVSESDLVFVDPPYSGVHYSRFYHVLETIAAMGCSAVSGEGRYPPTEERPISDFSKQTTSMPAFEKLVGILANRGATVIVTFPAGSCSNGISGKDVEEICGSKFRVRKRVVKSRFSTLGGNNAHRSARKLSDELILLLES